MKRHFLAVFLLVGALILAIQPALVFAQDYSFQVTRAQVNFFINSDGTVTLEYTYDFTNNPGGHIIDYVDIGMPNSDFDLGMVTADVNGNPITDIANSDYVKPGIALGLGRHSIPPGGKGVVHAKISSIPHVIFQSDLTQEKEPYASVSFSPSWFDSAYAKGATDYTVTIFLPPELQSEEPRYHTPEKWPGQSNPQTGVDQATVLKFYTWQANNADASTQYKFGASFPARLVPDSAVQAKPLVNITLPGFEAVFCWCFGGFFLLIFGGAIWGSIWGARHRKLQYLPPKIAIEGMGVKRGLTAVEAAILMEQPMDKILTMILFGTVKKGAATVVSKDPLKIEAANPLPANLNNYEKDFLAAMQENQPGDRRKSMQTVMINLVKTITEKMKGFSRKETIAYYESIMQQAWKQVEDAATPEVKSQAFDDNLDWSLLDRRFNDRTRETFRTGPVFVPIWWGRYDPVFAPGASGGGLTNLGGGGQTISIPRPNVPGSDFAASLVNGIQNFAAGAVGDLTGFTGGITDKTNPAPVSTTSGSSSGGGHCACACACACAGCACACAGGGR